MMFVFACLKHACSSPAQELNTVLSLCCGTGEMKRKKPGEIKLLAVRAVHSRRVNLQLCLALLQLELWEMGYLGKARVDPGCGLVLEAERV